MVTYMTHFDTASLIDPWLIPSDLSDPPVFLPLHVNGTLRCMSVWNLCDFWTRVSIFCCLLQARRRQMGGKISPFFKQHNIAVGILECLEFNWYLKSTDFHKTYHQVNLLRITAGATISSFYFIFLVWRRIWFEFLYPTLSDYRAVSSVTSWYIFSTTV